VKRKIPSPCRERDSNTLSQSSSGPTLDASRQQFTSNYTSNVFRKGRGPANLSLRDSNGLRAQVLQARTLPVFSLRFNLNFLTSPSVISDTTHQNVHGFQNTKLDAISRQAKQETLLSQIAIMPDSTNHTDRCYMLPTTRRHTYGASRDVSDSNLNSDRVPLRIFVVFLSPVRQILEITDPTRKPIPSTSASARIPVVTTYFVFPLKLI
jgi:hypothetical protein